MNLALEDKLLIAELMSRAAYALDERVVDMLAGCFAEDAQFSMRIGGGDLVGPFETRQGIMQLMTDSMATQTDQRRHCVSNLFFDDSGSGALEVVSNLTLLATENGEICLLSAGVYRDQVVKGEAGWQLHRRHLELDRPY